MQKLWINKKHKQFIHVRGMNQIPNMENAEILYTFYDKIKSIKIMVLEIDQDFFILSLMFDGSIEQGELIRISSMEFGKKMIESFRGYIYGQNRQTTN
jgi:hypothetical protein